MGILQTHSCTPESFDFFLILMFLFQEKYVIISKLIKEELSSENKITFEFNKHNRLLISRNVWAIVSLN